MPTVAIPVPGFLRLIANLACVFLLLRCLDTFPVYQLQIPNGNKIPHPCDRSITWQGVGHENSSGTGPRNPFGLDFAAAGHKWTEVLCRQDSDGDGRTNGQELGDPDCTWNMVSSPPVTDTAELSHPGVCEPVTSPLCREKNKFLSKNALCRTLLAEQETTTTKETSRSTRTERDQGTTETNEAERHEEEKIENRMTQSPQNEKVRSESVQEVTETTTLSTLEETTTLGHEEETTPFFREETTEHLARDDVSPSLVTAPLPLPDDVFEYGGGPSEDMATTGQEGEEREYLEDEALAKQELEEEEGDENYWPTNVTPPPKYIPLAIETENFTQHVKIPLLRFDHEMLAPSKLEIQPRTNALEDDDAGSEVDVEGDEQIEGTGAGFVPAQVPPSQVIETPINVPVPSGPAGGQGPANAFDKMQVFQLPTAYHTVTDAQSGQPMFDYRFKPVLQPMPAPLPAPGEPYYFQPPRIAPTQWARGSSRRSMATVPVPTILTSTCGLFLSALFVTMATK